MIKHKKDTKGGGVFERRAKNATILGEIVSIVDQAKGCSCKRTRPPIKASIQNVSSRFREYEKATCRARPRS